MDVRTLLKPSPVTSGAGIGIIAPASFARQERFTGGMERLRTLGFVPQIAENVLMRGPLFFAGTPQQRVADLHAMFADHETQAVMCLRGGYG